MNTDKHEGWHRTKYHEVNGVQRDSRGEDWAMSASNERSVVSVFICVLFYRFST
jgi:hypothetical protein